MTLDKRQHERYDSKLRFKIYTSLTRCAYSVDISDVSKKGAFIKSKYIPQIGETITYVVLNGLGTKLQTGNAKIVRTKETGSEQEVGFAIEMEQELQEDIVNKTMQ